MVNLVFEAKVIKEWSRSTNKVKMLDIIHNLFESKIIQDRCSDVFFPWPNRYPSHPFLALRILVASCMPFRKWDSCASTDGFQRFLHTNKVGIQHQRLMVKWYVVMEYHGIHVEIQCFATKNHGFPHGAVKQISHLGTRLQPNCMILTLFIRKILIPGCPANGLFSWSS